MSDGARVLVVDDEAPVRRFLKHALEGAGLRVVEAATGREALSLAAQFVPEVVLLDLGLPDEDGLAVCRALREWYRGAILVVSAREDEAVKVRALDDGADDYVTKPFGVPELLARVRVALRHGVPGADALTPRVEAGDLTIDVAAHRVWWRGEEVKLTDTEFRLLRTLTRHVGKVVTHLQLTRELWGPHAHDKGHDLRVHVAAIRKKLPTPDGVPSCLQTELGIGYRLVVDGTPR